MNQMNHSEEEELKPWLPILSAWKCYREAVWHWWSVVYAVFSTGGDLAPVQAQLVEVPYGLSTYNFTMISLNF